MRILRNCCRLALSASSLWNSWPLRREGERERESGSLHWKPWEELEVTCYICIIQQSDKPMILNRDFFFSWWGRDFLFFCVFFFFDGKCELFLIPNDYFWSKEGWQHWHIIIWQGPLSKWRSPRTEIKKPGSPHLQCRDHQRLTDSISSPSLVPTVGRCRCPLPRPS